MLGKSGNRRGCLRKLQSTPSSLAWIALSCEGKHMSRKEGS